MHKIIFVILLGLIILFGAWDIARQFFHLADAHQRIDDLKIAIQKENDKQKNQLISGRKITKISKDEMLGSLFSNIQMSGLLLQSVRVTPNDNGVTNASLTVDVVYAGNFSQIISFVAHISRHCIPFTISQMEIKKNPDQLSLKLKLNILDICVKPIMNIPLQLNVTDSVDNVLTNVGMNQNSVLSLYSIKQLKFVGYIQHSNQMAAIIMLPNGESSEVRVGNKIGVEKAQIIHINENNMLVRDGEKNILFNNGVIA